MSAESALGVESVECVHDCAVTGWTQWRPSPSIGPGTLLSGANLRKSVDVTPSSIECGARSNPPVWGIRHVNGITQVSTSWHHCG